MKTVLISLCVALLTIPMLSACDFFLDGESYSDVIDDSGDSPAEPADSLSGTEPVREKHTYMTGVEFPQDYDWQKDSAYGVVNARIIMFKDSERILSLETGQGQEISADPDMHHLIGGHLFTEYSGPSETVIRRDGVLLYRFPSREILKGMVLSGDNVYTLTQNRSGTGLNLRMNGHTIFQDDSGEVIGSMYEVTMLPTGALYEDDGRICFCFSKRMSLGDTAFSSWYKVVDGTAEQVSIPSDIKTVFDMRVFNGEVFAVCSTGSYAPMLLSGDEMYDLSSPMVLASKDYRLFHDEGEVLFYGTAIEAKTGLSMTGIWNRYGFQFTFSGNRTKIYSFSLSPSYIFYDSAGKIVSHSQSVGDYSFPDSYYLFSCRNACCDNGKMYLALTSKGKSPTSFLYCDGEISKVQINGFLTAVSIDY